MKSFLKLLSKNRFSLSTRIILAMAGIVGLTAISSVIIFNIIITTQTREVEDKFRKISEQVQEFKKQNPIAPQTMLDQVKVILNNPELSAETQWNQIRNVARSGDMNFGVVQNILREAGLPVSSGRRPPPRDGEEATSVFIKDGAPSAIRINPGPNFTLEAQQAESWIISPVLQSFLIGSSLAAIFAVMLGLILSRTIIQPLRKLEQASERIADGNYSLELPDEGKDDIARLARSFNKMAHNLRLTEIKRKELVANVAHELRTPLSAIQGYTEVLRDGLISNRERQTEIHNNILREVRHVASMVESMRTWLSNEQALEHLNVEELPASLPAKMVLERFEQTAAQKEVTLKLSLAQEAVVRADSDAVAHVLSNLVDNSLRYTSAGGQVEIKISAPTAILGADKKKRVIWFEVADTGKGIAEEHLPFIFERFYRVDKSRDRKTGGTGLGLAIVRDTVQALGGEVSIESKVGSDSGTTIRFWLPATVQEIASRPLALAAKTF